jgi:hypothetical protein
MANKIPLKLESGKLKQFASGDTISAAIAPGSGGTPLFTTVEVSLLSAPFARRSGHFTITSSGLTANKAVVIKQAVGPYTNKGARFDEAEMDSIAVTGKVRDATTIDVYWETLHRVRGNYKFDYIISG